MIFSIIIIIMVIMQSKTALFTNLLQYLEIADRVMLLHQGKLLFYGPPADLLASGKLNIAYSTEFETLTRRDGSLWVAPLAKRHYS